VVPKVSDVIRMIEEIAPTYLAEDWDNVGLLVGERDASTSKVLLCIDVTLDTVLEAIQKKVNLIIAHHPIIFEPLKNIQSDSYVGKILSLLIKNDISVYCCHTNLDKAEFGTDYALAKKLCLENIEVLSNEKTERVWSKITVYVPTGYEEHVFKAMVAAGAGEIGDYRQCSFRSSGVGTFLPVSNAIPFKGKYGELEFANETRLEMVVSNAKLRNVITNLISAHPYEEPVYDTQELSTTSLKTGMGRIGNLVKRVSMRSYIKDLGAKLRTPHISFFGDLDSEVERVAVCGGSGADIVRIAESKGADLFITGEMKYHKALELNQKRLAVVVAGHYSTEAPVLAILDESLQKRASTLQYNLEILLSDTQTEPFSIIDTQNDLTLS